MDILKVNKEEYTHESKLDIRTEKIKKKEIIMQMLEAKQDLMNANENFNYAEEELIDFYAYEIKAFRSKLDYLIRVAKENKIEFKYKS